MIDIRKQIVKEARKYLGTPFHHQGRLIEVGIDCVGLIALVAKVLGLCDYDQHAYTAQPTGILPEKLAEGGYLEKPIDQREPGDIGLFWFHNPGLPQHLGIFTDVGLIHTYGKIGKVVEHGMNKLWKKLLVAVYEFPGVAEWRR